LKKTLEQKWLIRRYVQVFLGCKFLTRTKCMKAQRGIAVGQRPGLTSFLVGIYFPFNYFFLDPFIALIPLAVILLALLVIVLTVVAGNLKDI